MSYLGSIQIFVTAYAQSDFFGKLIFLGLFLLSVICWVVLIQKIRATYKISKKSLKLKDLLKENQKPLLTLNIQESHPFALIFLSLKQKTLQLLEKNHFFLKEQNQEGVYLTPADLEAIETHVLTSVSTESKLIEKDLFILAVIVTLAPFLGLLGTVWGILVTFSALQGGASNSNSLILGGLATALATTVLGLVIAIPALVAYGYLKNASKRLTSEMEDLCYQLLSKVELQYRKME